MIDTWHYMHEHHRELKDGELSWDLTAATDNNCLQIPVNKLLLPGDHAYVPLQIAEENTYFVDTSNWGNIPFTDELGFSIQSDSRKIVSSERGDSATFLKS
ncbi:hypothetical protein AVEN_121156-1 [Araneus ventricosus]|uniref:Uncharacterized protein n=1 Tax=Araneus ventricosus TaxID=182803 RepID=A0A4Y2E3C4_ARAVE|nr:hypothetical protein AVEN_121156-1 [Araneus ventricosus]